MEETGEGRGGEEDIGTVAATYVENRVTNHKRVYGGASDHWPQRIIDGYGRCRVSIRRTIEMKGCTRTVKADLVRPSPDKRTSRASTTGIAIPLDYTNPLPLLTSLLYRVSHYVHPHGTRFDCEALSVPTDLLYQLVAISCRLFPSLVFRSFSSLFLTEFSVGCSGLIATFAVDNGSRAEWNDSAQSRRRYFLSRLTFENEAVVVID